MYIIILAEATIKMNKVLFAFVLSTVTSNVAVVCLLPDEQIL